MSMPRGCFSEFGIRRLEFRHDVGAPTSPNTIKNNVTKSGIQTTKTIIDRKNTTMTMVNKM